MSVTVRKLSVAQWRSNRRLPNPTRPARPKQWRLLDGLDRNGYPQYELEAWCDDGRPRWFVWRAGRWVRKTR